MRSRRHKEIDSNFTTRIMATIAATSLVIACLYFIGIISLDKARDTHVSTVRTDVPDNIVAAVLPEMGNEDVVNSLQSVNDASSEVGGRWKGLCPKDTVHSINDFRRIVNSDPVLKEHFSQFDFAHAYLIKRDVPTSAYVTHREGSLITQTSKPIQMPANDVHIADGSVGHEVRLRCCNDVSAKPTEKISKDFIPPVATYVEPTPTIQPPTYRFGSGPRGSIVIPPTPPVPPTVTPEPATFILVGIGLLALVVWRKK